MEDSRPKQNREEVFSKRVKAGKRTYFIDVKPTNKGEDFFITITESKRRFDGYGYDKHKIFLYKEDFNKFTSGLAEVIDHVKTELMPGYDFDMFSHENHEHSTEQGSATEEEFDMDKELSNLKNDFEY